MSFEHISSVPLSSRLQEGVQIDPATSFVLPYGDEITMDTTLGRTLNTSRLVMVRYAPMRNAAADKQTCASPEKCQGTAHECMQHPSFS